jgi:hypothetical protein
MHLRLNAAARVALQYRCATVSCVAQLCGQQLQCAMVRAARGCVPASMVAVCSSMVYAQMTRGRVGRRNTEGEADLAPDMKSLRLSRDYALELLVATDRAERDVRRCEPIGSLNGKSPFRSRASCPWRAPDRCPPEIGWIDMTSHTSTRRVSCDLVMSIDQPTRVTLQIAVPGDESLEVAESLRVTCNGVAVELSEVTIPHVGRAHVCFASSGRMSVGYDAVVTGAAAAPLVTEADRIIYRRPSRYAESDRLAPIAQAEFAGIAEPTELFAAVSSWTGSQLSYVPGSSGPTEGAVDTMLKRRGVCRDYAHLVVALLRAVDVPARLAAVYAPGLAPMDFHAVAEAAVGDTWRVVDATLLAPRSSLVRIATGRDAADTAFLSSYGGQADLLDMSVTATVDGPLPADDVLELVSIR